MQHMTIEEYQKYIAKNKGEAAFSCDKKKAQNKYHNQKVTVDGIQFDSIIESDRYLILKQYKAAGLILDFKRQPSFLFESGIRYRPDFIVWGLNGIPWVEDTKGKKTKDFALKEKLWKNEYPQMKLIIIFADKKNTLLD
mgnify:CR=1 FL=1